MNRKVTDEQKEGQSECLYKSNIIQKHSLYHIWGKFRKLGLKYRVTDNLLELLSQDQGEISNRVSCKNPSHGLRFSLYTFFDHRTLVLQIYFV